MGLLGDLIKTAADVMTSGRRQSGTPSREAGRRGRRRPASTPTARSSSSSPAAAPPGNHGPVRMSSSPQTHGAPDPGEVVWTWVPFEENDGRGKDRPVLVVAVEPRGTYLAGPLTSNDPH